MISFLQIVIIIILFPKTKIRKIKEDFYIKTFNVILILKLFFVVLGKDLDGLRKSLGMVY